MLHGVLGHLTTLRLLFHVIGVLGHVTKRTKFCDNTYVTVVIDKWKFTP